MTEFIWKLKPLSGHDCMMIFDDAEFTGCESVVTCFRKNSNFIFKWHVYKWTKFIIVDYAELWSDTVNYREKG